MATERGKKPRRTSQRASWGRKVLLGSALTAATAVIGTAAVVVGSAAAIARRVVVPSAKSDEDITIMGVDLNARPATVTLSRSPHSVLAGTPGEYSLWFAQGAGHAVVGKILSEDDRSVTREIVRRGFGDLERARRGRMNGWLWLSPADAGLDFQPVAVTAEHGLNPAWLFPGGAHASTWVLHVHGHGSKRAETLRGVVSLVPWGFTQMAVSYRNDGEAHRSDDGRYALGDREWRDVDAAISFARKNGAQRVILVGWSMGGSIVLQAAARSAQRDIIEGLILDSPAVDWIDVLHYQGDAIGAPSPVTKLTIGMIGSKAGRPLTGQHEPVDFAHLRWTERAADLAVPTLLFHSDDDGLVPPGPSREFAAARPDLVTFVPFDTAVHCRLWNYDRPRWEAAVSSWLAERGYAQPE